MRKSLSQDERQRRMPRSLRQLKKHIASRTKKRSLLQSEATKMPRKRARRPVRKEGPSENSAQMQPKMGQKGRNVVRKSRFVIDGPGTFTCSSISPKLAFSALAI